MHVLLTADTLGGVWPYTMELARGLARQDVTASVATMGGRLSAEQRREAMSIPGVELFESEFRLPWMSDPWDDVTAAGEWLLDIAARTEPEIVHLSEPVHAALPWGRPAVAVGHSCVLSWWEAVHGEPAPPEWHRYHSAMRAGFHAAAAVAAPSRSMLSAIQRHYVVPGGHVIPNGREVSRFQPAAKEPVVFAAGRLWDRAKNMEALARAAAGLAWPVYLAGDARHPDGRRPDTRQPDGRQPDTRQPDTRQPDGRQPDTRQPDTRQSDGRHLDARQPEARHLDTRHPGALEPSSAPAIRLLGQLSAANVAAWQARASIYALPARYEPFGLSILEAALSGCALVLGDLPSQRELWDGVAVFVDPDDSDMLHTALAGLIGDPYLRQMLALRARRRALSFTADRMAAAYLDLYTNALNMGATCAS